MQKLNDRWMRIIGVPVLALAGQWMMYGYTNVPYPDDWRIPIFFVAGTVIVWECNRIGIIFSRRRFPELTQTPLRVVYQLLWFILFCAIIRITQTYIYQLVGLWHSDEYFQFRPYFFNTLVSVAGTTQVAAYFEGVYLYQRWKHSYSEAQELKKSELAESVRIAKNTNKPSFSI